MSKIVEELIHVFRDYVDVVEEHEWVMEGISGEERSKYLLGVFEKQENKFLTENIIEVLNNNSIQINN